MIKSTEKQQRKKGNKTTKPTDAARKQRVMQMAELGKSGKALRAITSPGIAADTPQAQKVLVKKFPNRKDEVRVRPVPPQTCDVTPADVVKDILSFDKGAECGPTGLRPQFLRDMIGAEGDEDILGVYTERIQIFVDGRVPAYLRQWYGGGTLVGTGKDGKPLDEDARPLVVGEVWRRLAAKVALRSENLSSEESDIAEYLKPNQVAVGTKAGSEVAIHTLRQWCKRHISNTDIAALKRDYENAFNEADEHEFLMSCYERLPNCARLAEWCYGEPVNLIYHGRVLTSQKGQQGCPLMMPMYCAMRQKMRELTPTANRQVVHESRLR